MLGSVKIKSAEKNFIEGADKKIIDLKSDVMISEEDEKNVNRGRSVSFQQKIG